MARTYRTIHPNTRRRIAFQRRVWAYVTQVRDRASDRARLHTREMAQALGAAPSAVLRAIGHLEANGYVQRVATCPAGRRQSLLVVEVVMPFLIAA